MQLVSCLPCENSRLILQRDTRSRVDVDKQMCEVSLRGGGVGSRCVREERSLSEVSHG